MLLLHFRGLRVVLHSPQIGINDLSVEVMCVCVCVCVCVCAFFATERSINNEAQSHYYTQRCQNRVYH